MAGDDRSSQLRHVSIGSTDTALCIVPPTQAWPSIDSLRSRYDKAYMKWPPHINLIYPFVGADDLPLASGLIASRLNSSLQPLSQQVRLDAVGTFIHRHDNTIFLHDSDEVRDPKLRNLRKALKEALTGHASPDSYRMHLTIGQSQDHQAAPHKFLMAKAYMLPKIEWTVDKLHIMIRERENHGGNSFNQMKVWGIIDLNTTTLQKMEHPTSLYPNTTPAETNEGIDDAESITRFPYTYSSDEWKWIIERDQNSHSKSEEDPTPEISIASYNVLAEFEYPPSKSRDPLVVEAILRQSTCPDVLVLQEVTDDFLDFICDNQTIREYYHFVTHGPPSQFDIEPLPSHLNTVVFSRWNFTWTTLSFQRRHKGSVILKFSDIGIRKEDDVFLPLILSTVHLTRGLTDGSVATKKTELQSILNYLSKNYPQSPWILAGDFNMTTSSYTIQAALKKKMISSQTVTCLENIETMLSETGLVDSWSAARVQYGDRSDLDYGMEFQKDTFEGEQGATFNPLLNSLAAELVGSGLNNRPQRYDRILVKGEGAFDIAGFALFGRKQGYLSDSISINNVADNRRERYDPTFAKGEDALEVADSRLLNQKEGHHPDHGLPSTNNDSGLVETQKLSYASDHWGIKCLLKLRDPKNNQPPEETERLIVPVHLTSAPESLADVQQLKSCLDEQGVLPLSADLLKGKKAFELLRTIVLDVEDVTTQDESGFVVVPVGSFGLGVWTTSSDIDCLCLGPISSRTFFALAIQRLRKAAARDVKVLRRVNANSGTMLELEVLDIKMDLQYCPSALIAETWPNAMRLPPNDPVFSLPTQTLAKLKPVRDMYYIRHTVPDYAAFRTAYHVIKLWAKRRGVYSSKFGLLGGIHISILLSRVCKMLSQNGESVSLPSLLTTFFSHYASFNWTSDMVFDPFFHKNLRYVRTAREPLAILGLHPPSLNTAHAASLPSVRTISEEFERADASLSEEGATWEKFLDSKQGSSEFLSTFKTFVKIDVQFWGVSLAKGSGFVGWLESRCVMLLVDLNRRVPSIHARIWPARFVSESSSEDDTDYQGCYLIGLDKWEKDGRIMAKDDMKAALNSLHAALQKFESQIRGDEKYFDANTSWMSATLVNQSELGNLRLDTREWGDYTIGEDESDEEEEEEEEDEIFASDEGEQSSKKSKSKKNKDKTSLPSRPAYKGKFRASADVINRIRWDPNMDSSDYIVGYEDRFLGAKERALDLWKSEQTDEEFIPQHRILYFKRASDGVVVWDRKERKDIIFGSGVSSLSRAGNAGSREV
ncbi:hypothetical protein F5Y16DRAFT_375716 [Xylariaceae sp. FL0255]|nr:hypothetical protein F5Y16DRAFT_375716 [Xylariaceae sp. FL0255]